MYIRVLMFISFVHVVLTVESLLLNLVATLTRDEWMDACMWRWMDAWMDGITDNLVSVEAVCHTALKQTVNTYTFIWAYLTGFL